jgi:hypothetical protein
MRPSSSISGSRDALPAAGAKPPARADRRRRSRRGPHWFLATFFGILFVVVAGVNLAVLKAHQWRRYRPQSEYDKKMQNAGAAYAAGRPISAIFAGDSTVSVGIMPRLLGPEYLNVAWSGFDPSELQLLEDRLSGFPIKPSVVFLGINPTFLSQNEWGDTLSVPAGAAFLDGITSFYDDTNSFKPLVIMGGLAALSNRMVSPLDGSGHGHEQTFTRLIVESDGLLVVDPEIRRPVQTRDLKLPYRSANFRMIETFRRTLAKRGTRVVWLFMPYAAAFERTLREGSSSRAFLGRYQEEIKRIFGEDVIDLSGAVPDESFRDEGHLTKAGARSLTMKLAERLTRFRAARTVPVPAERAVARPAW